MRATRLTARQSSGAIWRTRLWLRLSNLEEAPYDFPALHPLVYPETSGFDRHSKGVELDFPYVQIGDRVRQIGLLRPRAGDQPIRSWRRSLPVRRSKRRHP